ncbi:MAG: hypothetical protein AB1641_22020 [Thermodesulfobacteriota bacterium]
MHLSVIIPYAGEHPHVIHTIASVHHELDGRDIDYEIIAVDNHCPEFEAQGRLCPKVIEKGFRCQKLMDQGYVDRRSRESVDAAAGLHPWLKSLDYTERLCHWQAKNVGVRASSGHLLWFCDAHCAVPRGVLWDMFRYYWLNHDRLDGSLHLANTYKLLEAKPNPYKLVNRLDQGFIGYALTRWTYSVTPDGVIEVPAASTCGMMTTRALWDSLGGWPQKYAYGGGENFWNFVLATMGKKKWLWTRGFLRHQGEPRDYHYTGDGLVWNRCAAMLMVGGQALAERYIRHCPGDPATLRAILEDVLSSCSLQRAQIAARQTIGINDWIKEWAC